MTVADICAAIDLLGDPADPDEVAEVIEVMADLEPIALDTVTTHLKKKTGLGKVAISKQVRALQKSRKPSRDEEETDDEFRLLETGSDREVAAFVLNLVRAGSIPIVHCEDKFWRYANGVWSVVMDDELARETHKLDGEACRDGFWKANHNRVKGAIACARDIVAAADHFDNARRGIALANGFVSIADDGTASFEALTPEHRARAFLAWSYNPEATAPRFLQYLNEVFKEDGDAEAKILFLQQFIGACVSGFATRFQTCCVLVGEGDNGKSVFLNIVQALFPPETVASVPPQRLSSEYYVAKLAGARINIVAEAPRSDIENAEDFKAIVSGDKVTGRWPAGRPFDFHCQAGELFACNNLFGTADQSKGFWKRFTLIAFTRSFKETEMDRGLAARIVATELPGILNWALAGARSALTAGGYSVPASTLLMQSDWRNDVDQVMRFAQEQLERTDEGKDPGMSGMDLYRTYTRWAEDNGYKRTILSNPQFASRLIKLPGFGFVSKHTKHGSLWNTRILITGKVIPFSR